MHDETPEDPFHGDPFDPSAALGDGGNAAEPLDSAEAEEVLADLADVEIFRVLLEPRGIRGVVIECAQCGETHYLNWDLLHGNLRQLLEDGQPQVHEPACAPDPDDYVSWDYARGYVDAVIDTEDDDGR